MPIRANQDYWHKINELWAKEAQSQSEKTSQNLTALSGYRYLYKQNQLVAEAPLQITKTEGNLALTQANWADAITGCIRKMISPRRHVMKKASYITLLPTR